MYLRFMHLNQQAQQLEGLSIPAEAHIFYLEHRQLKPSPSYLPENRFLLPSRLPKYTNSVTHFLVRGTLPIKKAQISTTKSILNRLSIILDMKSNL